MRREVRRQGQASTFYRPTPNSINHPLGAFSHPIIPAVIVYVLRQNISKRVGCKGTIKGLRAAANE